MPQPYVTASCTRGPTAALAHIAWLTWPSLLPHCSRQQVCKQLTCYKCKTVISAVEYPNLEMQIREWRTKDLQRQRAQQAQQAQQVAAQQAQAQQAQAQQAQAQQAQQQQLAAVQAQQMAQQQQQPPPS